MSDPEASILISNGTCFYAEHTVADEAFIPCGNSLFGHIHCCSAGNKCLTDNAFYSDEFDMTYLAGCTDGNYDHEICPDKKAFRAYPWAGLIYCRPNEWWVPESTPCPDSTR
ncbi:hypothetical protein MFIFM68171_08929 [Madurella fahalii]|uniref:Uncharacterized protein n=1 Tax=Madurella fahalii TaxID=1157608 RepID=A0ABQ0GLY9_9PEZI